ncbi:2-oxoglutarate dehydrogenase E1 component [Chitinophaga sancti]|uniref:oxoglutarate dehydrogenase (succinyl-transferring) n=1 Tax=Chitinophaga sancti TaxID=1004 RepID=A0A1K1RCQ3_9BACT|nr:2-oxoglutarate dehydrogenase E1 component [Chitinophaga sancti]WQD65625.1 2-oxoglutarate dehydrogenase E1 component [Chitinophaga sancti]WQG88752.1 2-oxoglutarate dehydrogenase E1 component [Chitinophaga sancti]SFW69832.1 2-oxoglutarate dehydrogenase E1 component [Chitinophaga sancti]
MKDFSFVTNSHPAYIESLYQDYRKDPGAVDPEWGKFFEGFDFAVNNVNGKAPGAGAPVSSDQLTKELNVYRLIQAYRKKGHLISKTNPIRERKDRQANLDISFFGLTEADLKTEFYIGQELGLGKTSLENIVSRLKQVYTASVGLEYAYVNDAKKVEWLQREMETTLQRTLTLDQRKRILHKLNQGVIFEKFLHTKYIGQKRFGLEGGENTIPALDAIINTAAGEGVQEAVIGMAHRGRLNVLANILGKTYEQIFNEFEGHSVPDLTMGSGDVKYHLGFRSIVDTTGGEKVNLQLLPNPSHLEVVDPLVTGFARSKADVIYNSDYDKILPILIHGDAAVAGQGVIYELIQMSNLKGYYTGGTMHLVINNQIGFTTDFDDARSSDYCTSIAATVQAPVFHVNGDDAEAVVKVSEIAARYRQEFNSDIFIDLLCYRRHGHNEGDEPKFTQPSLYSLIDKHPNPREVYTQYLLHNGESEVQDLAKEMEKGFWAQLQERLDEVRQHPLPYTYQKPEQWWQELRKSRPEDFDQSPVTAVKEEEVRRLIGRLMTWPKEFVPLRKVEKLLQDKIKLYETEGKVDWATGELLAYASLLSEGKDVRMSGEDVKRGTFSHRHAILFDENTNATYSRLGELQEKQGSFRIYNSLLSEFAVLGFEYGYAMANPKSLVIWEAQYGDFANGAQTVIDQYITSAEQKWTNQNGMVMLLPHGYEGGGPDHSNARPERFLQSCAEYNIIVTNITTAANFFHALRRQLTWEFRKPLVNFSPKANLRHVGSYSPIAAFTEGGFKEVLDDEYVDDASKVKKVLLCTGKIYFELAEKQAKDNRKDVAIVRLEQLYPLPTVQLEALNQKYKAATWFWVQEEPLNMGAASYLQMNMKQLNYGVISRNPSAATATGYAKVHAREQLEIIETAFNI